MIRIDLDKITGFTDYRVYAIVASSAIRFNDK